MGAWGAPLAAGAFWAGLLAWDGRPGALQTWPAWAWLAVGVAILAASWVAAPGSRRGDPLGRAGLTRSDPAAVVAVSAAATDGRRGPLAALTLLIVGVFVCGVGWGGVAQARRETSLLGRLAPPGGYDHDDLSRRRDVGPEEPLNGHAHSQHLLLSTSETLPVTGGRLALGAWQSIFLVELCSPRVRRVTVQVIGR